MSQNSKLTEIGIDVNGLSSEQRSVLAALSTQELDVLASVKRRLETAGGDVEGHSEDPGVIGSVVF